MDRTRFFSTFAAATAFAGTALGQNPVLHEGLLHSALGQAQLSQQNGQLIVSNIGSSGQDGVRISLGDSEWNTLEIEVPDPDDLPSIANDLKIWPEVDAGPAGLVRPWILCVNDIGDDFIAQLDPGPMQGTQLRVDALLDGVVVDSVLWPQPQGGITTAVFAPGICCVDPFWTMGNEEWLILDLSAPGDVTLTNGGGQVIADQLIMALSGSQIPVSSVQEMVIQSTIPQLIIGEEAIGQFGLAHSAEGQAQLEAQGGRLKVSNLGSSGCDGVSIDLGDTSTHHMELEPLLPQILPPGAFLDFTTFGQGLPTPDICNLHIEYDGLGFGASLDTTLIGVAGVRVDLMLDGELLQSQLLPPPLPGDVLAQFPPQGCQIDPLLPVAGELWTMIDMPQPAPIALPGQPPVIGNRIVMAMVGPQQQVGPLSSTRVLGGGGLQDFTLRAEDVFFPKPYAYCTAKVNSQNCVPSISWLGTPTLGGPDDFNITASNVINNKPGLFFHGFGTINVPFFNGTLCVLPPLTRTSIQISGGNPPPDDCSGSYTYHFTQARMAALGLSPGDSIYGQYWSRDTLHPDGTGVGLTNAIRFPILP